MTKKILVVDDNEINLKLLEKIIITHTEQNVILARDGKEAISLACEHLPFLIFMDMMMPVVDGYKATAKIKETETCKDIPIVAVTAVHTKEGIREVFECGCEDILPKPIDVKIVVEIINKYHDKIFEKNLEPA